MAWLADSCCFLGTASHFSTLCFARILVMCSHTHSSSVVPQPPLPSNLPYSLIALMTHCSKSWASLYTLRNCSVLLCVDMCLLFCFCGRGYNYTPKSLSSILPNCSEQHWIVVCCRTYLHVLKGSHHNQTRKVAWWFDDGHSLLLSAVHSCLVSLRYRDPLWLRCRDQWMLCCLASLLTVCTFQSLVSLPGSIRTTCCNNTLDLSYLALKPTAQGSMLSFCSCLYRNRSETAIGMCWCLECRKK